MAPYSYESKFLLLVKGNPKRSFLLILIYCKFFMLFEKYSFCSFIKLKSRHVGLYLGVKSIYGPIPDI